MSDIAIEGQGNIPGKPVLVLPNRLDLGLMRALETALGGSGRIAWMVDYNAMPGSEIMNYLATSRADGLWLNMQRMSKEVISEQIHDKFKLNRHVVLLPAHVAQQNAALADVEPQVLHCVDDSTLPALPVYTGMYSKDFQRAICTEEPADMVCMQILPLQQAGPGLGARVRGAWMEAAADQLARHPLLLDGTLSSALMQSLVKHPKSRIIDGVDDSDLNYETLLTLALLVGGYLRKFILCRTIGIILPPGKYSAIANLACLFAGIVPVNFNYNASAESFRAQANLTSVNRFITERRFTLKQQSFAWPRKLDHLYLEDIIREIGSFRIRLCTQLIRWGKLSFVAKRVGVHMARPGDTAAIFFTKSVGAGGKGVPMTHRMLLSAALQTRSRLDLRENERVLSVTPYYEPYSYLMGLLVPLLGGQGIVTYPTPDAPQRLCSLMRNYSPVLTTFTMRQTYELLGAANPETFSAMRHFFVTGGRLTPQLYQKALTDFKLTLHNAYTVTESAAPVSLCLPAPAGAESGHYIPAGTPGTAGCPMTGMAVRIVDTDRATRVLSPNSLGCIWLKSPALPSAYLADGKRPTAPENMQEGWFNTGDVGCVDAEGMLRVYGRRARFSKVNGVVTSHEMVEEVILNELKPESNGQRVIAIVGYRGLGNEQLVMLSTVHSGGPQDVLTLRYKLTNARYPSHWAPDLIISVRSIPCLSNGQLDYPACVDIVNNVLGNK